MIRFTAPYTCAVTDNPTVYLSITRSGERKIIEHYAPDMNGPARLRMLEETIDAVQPYITWTRM